MSTGYMIRDVAARSGFSAATLRYYEEIGLLPAASRTPSGYRMYDDGTFERLAFISRAKQLGCSLEEIADLTIAWDGGRCGPVQDGLRSLVADKLAAAERQIAALTTLTVDLRRAAGALDAHRPDGPCDDACGCITDPTAERVTQPAVLGQKPASSDTAAPIACTLQPTAMPGRLGDWQRLLAHVVEREAIEGGVRVTFGPAVPLGELGRLAAAEWDCCRFFSFAITIDGRGVALEVRAPNDGLPVVEALFGGTR